MSGIGGVDELLNLGSEDFGILGIDFELGLFLDTVLDEGLDEFVILVELFLFEEGFELCVELGSDFLVGFESPLN